MTNSRTRITSGIFTIMTIRRLHEMDSLRSTVDSLECANREICARVDELCSQLEESKGRICWLENTTGEQE